VPFGYTPLQAILAKRDGFVLEFVLETFEMSRAYAFWFHFYFPQPLAEGLS
jgi:hypothetical protein